jgi:hypothetical protein
MYRTGFIMATGNITGGNLNTSGLSLSGNVVSTLNITGNTISGNLSATGNVNGGNLRTAGLISATGTITSSTSVIGSTLSATGNIYGGNLSGTYIVGTLTTASQTNITSVGTLGSLVITGNVTSGNVSVTGLVSATGNITGSQFIGNGAPLASITGANVTGTVANATYATSAGSATTAGTVTTAAQSNITSVGTLTSLSVTGNVTGGNVTGTNLYGTLQTSTQLNITGLGTLTTLTVSGNTTSGNLLSGGMISTSGNITGSNLSVGTGTIIGGNIVNSNANGIGNIGSSVTYFNTVFAKATSAQYADLAEMYVADADYAPGTVVDFGGIEEITQTVSPCSTAVAGVISTNPSYIMNSGQQGKHVLPVALTGRVPCRVQGPVSKGDVLVSSTQPGVAQRIGTQYQPGCVIGKSLGYIDDSSVQTIEVVVGRF